MFGKYNYEISYEWKIIFTIKIDIISSKDTGKRLTMYLKKDKIEIMIGSNKSSLCSRYQ